MDVGSERRRSRDAVTSLDALIMRLMVDRSPRGGDGGNEAVRLKLQPLEGADLLHGVGDPPAPLAPDSPRLGLPRNGLPSLSLHVALMTGVNAHRSAIMRPSPSRVLAMETSPPELLKYYDPCLAGSQHCRIDVTSNRQEQTASNSFAPLTRDEDTTKLSGALILRSLISVSRLIVGNPEAN